MARRPPKFQRFMPPAKPLPVVVPVTSTNWPGDEVVGGDLGADRDHGILGHAELRELALRLDLGDREMAALGLRDVLHLGLADAELERRIAVLVLRPMGDDLAVVDLQDGHRDVFARVREDAGHPELLCNDA